MADAQNKRKAQEAFGSAKPRLSAVAAARAKAARSEAASQSTSGVTSTIDLTRSEAIGTSETATASATVAATPYEPESTSLADSEGDEPSRFLTDDERVQTAPQFNPSQKQLSKFRKGTPKQAGIQISNEKVWGVLKPEEYLTLAGHYDLQVIKGTVLVNGAIVRETEVMTPRIFAPSTQALPTIVAKSSEAEIVITAPKDHTLQDLAMLSPLYGKIWMDGSGVSKSFQLLERASDDPLKRALTGVEVDDESQRALNKILNSKSATQKIMVAGPKGTGKSTFSRLLANTLLTAPSSLRRYTIFWLDLDPGQPEFGAPGQVSLVQIRSPLFGPPFTHPAAHLDSTWRVIRSHTLASISPKEDPDHYIACALDLLSHHSFLVGTFPSSSLIVNCSGWIIGSAALVLQTLTSHIKPTDMVLMQPVDAETVTMLSSAAPNADLHPLPFRAKPQPSRTSAEMRAMQTLSYFHSAPSSPSPSASSSSSAGAEAAASVTWDTRPLSHMPPWKVKYTGSDAGILAIVSYGEAVDPNFLSTVLDGMVVAIVVLEDVKDALPDAGTRIARSNDGLPYLLPEATGLVKPLDPKFCRCVGLALVRGIDSKNGELQLLTPVGEAEVRGLEGGKTVLVRGRFDAPDWALLEDVFYASKGGEERVDAEEGGLERPYVAARRNDAGLGANVWRVRRGPALRKPSGGD